MTRIATSVYLEPAEILAIETYALVQGISKSRVIRKAIDKFLKEVTS